jgi:DNA-binding CsgD family transcriptional regulator
MTRHSTKQSVQVQSHIHPSLAAGVTTDMTLADTYVLLCDWHGRVVWKSGTNDRVAIGEEIWKHAASKSKERLRAAVAGVVTLREKCTIEAESDRGDHFRFWMWPLAEPALAVCLLALRIPRELALLTDRERACLECLAKGMSTREIAKELGIGLTTVHTHLRRSREKLGSLSAEALIVFAARYFATAPQTGTDDFQANQKRSG